MQHGRPECTRSSRCELGSVRRHATGASNPFESFWSNWIDQAKAEPSGPWEVKKADETGNLCDSDCADCRTAHGLEVESNRLENTDKAPDAV